MVISYFYPPTGMGDNFAKLFCKYTGYDFVDRECYEDVDFVYAGSVSVLKEAKATADKFKKPIVCWVWDIPYNWRDWVVGDPIGQQMNAFRDKVNAENITLLKTCDLVMCGSKWTYKILKEHGVKSKQIYGYIDFDTIDIVPEQVKEDQLIQISRYYFNKRFELSVLASRNTPYKMVCVGFGKDYLRARILGLPHDNLEAYCDLGREDVMRHLKRSKLLVSPSVFEGWGVTPIEAIHCKVPILLSDLPVFREVWGNRAVYHKIDDIDDMQHQITRIMESKDLQENIVKACEPVIKEFTPKKYAKRWKELIEEFIK